MFAQAIRRTKDYCCKQHHQSARRMSPTKISIRGRMPTPLPAFESLYCFSRFAPMLSISAFAWAKLIPLKPRDSVQARMIAALLPTHLAGELTDRHPHLDAAGY